MKKRNDVNRILKATSVSGTTYSLLEFVKNAANTDAHAAGVANRTFGSDGITFSGDVGSEASPWKTIIQP